MTSVTRTRMGIALFVPMAALLLAMFACLPAPVGDPEQSKVDEALAGTWVGGDDPKDLAVVALKPWDAKTYLAQYVATGNADGKPTRTLMHFKAWLTKLGDNTFITLQPMDEPDPAMKPFWVVARIAKVAGGLSFEMVNPENALIKAAGDKPTRDQLETILKAHANDAGLLGDKVLFKKATPEAAAEAMRKIDVVGGGK